MTTKKHFIVGLSGPAGCGKDTVREVLESLGFAGMAFADPIRSMLRELLTSNGISDAWMDSRELKEATIPELGVSYRQMAQSLGTEWGRALHPMIWLRLASAYLAEQMAQPGQLHFVISDVRFANEAQWVREHGGVIWRIERPGLVPVQDHVSEQELQMFSSDLVISNTGDLDDLRHAVFAAVGALA